MLTLALGINANAETREGVLDLAKFKTAYKQHEQICVASSKNYNEFFLHDSGFMYVGKTSNADHIKKTIKVANLFAKTLGQDIYTSTKDHSYLESSINNMHDYENLSNSCLNGNSNVNRCWYAIENEKMYFIKLIINDEGVSLNVSVTSFSLYIPLVLKPIHYSIMRN